MKYFGIVLPLAALLSLTAASPVNTPVPTPSSASSSIYTPTSTLPGSSASSSATCSCEPRICIQSWPQSCVCANKGKMDCYEKCGGDYPQLDTCE